MDLEQLGYFLYMEQCEKEEKERQQAEQQEKLNVRSQDHLEREQSTTDRKKDFT